MKIFGREPALILEALKAGLVALALVTPGLSNDVQVGVMVVATAAFALLQGLTTHPFQVTVVTGFISTVGVAIAAFGIDVPPDSLAAVVVLVGAVSTLISRSQISPKVDPLPVE